MSTMFNFNPETCAEAFAENGFIHIDNGLRKEFHHDLVKYIENSFNDKHLKDFARGDKQQALFEFLEPDHYEELRHAVAKVCGVEPGSLTLSERHIKQYEVDADPYPLAHKDRFGSEFAVGFSIIVPEGSTLVIYPEGDLTANPFNSTAELRSSFSPDDLPEPALKRARRVEIQDRPGDVQIFRGSAMWHLREHGAGTTVLYLKLNTFNCDTLAEDPHTPALRQQTLSRANSITSEWDTLIPVVARRVTTSIAATAAIGAICMASFSMGSLTSRSRNRNSCYSVRWTASRPSPKSACLCKVRAESATQARQFAGWHNAELSI